MSENNHSLESFFTGLVLGAILGAGFFYFLISTDEGKKVKKKIKEEGSEALENLIDLIEEIEKRGKELKEKAQEVQNQLEKNAISVISQVAQVDDYGRKISKFFTRNGKPLS